MPVLEQIRNCSSSSSNKEDKPLIGCVIMASGLGKRFGGNKLMADLGGKPLIQWILDTTRDLFDYRVVVTRSREVKELCDRNNIDVVLHSEPGRNDTVRIGLSLMTEKMECCCFMPADQPFIRRESFRKVLAAVKENPQYIWRTAFENQVGAPVCFPKWSFPELLTLPEGKGGNAVVKAHIEKVKMVQVIEPEELEDVDTIEDMQKAREYLFEKNKE